MTGLQTVLQPGGATLTQVSAYLPKLGGLLLILVIGALVAVGVTALAATILKLIQIEKPAKIISLDLSVKITPNPNSLRAINAETMIIAYFATLPSVSD